QKHLFGQLNRTTNGQTVTTQVVKTQSFVNHPTDIAASVFRREVQVNGKNGEQMNRHGFSFLDYQPGTMSRLQQLIIHTHQNGNAAEQQQFVREFQQMLARSVLKNIGGRQQLTMQLYPRHLGKLHVQLTHE